MVSVQKAVENKMFSIVTLTYKQKTILSVFKLNLLLISPFPKYINDDKIKLKTYIPKRQTNLSTG